MNNKSKALIKALISVMWNIFKYTLYIILIFTLLFGGVFIFGNPKTSEIANTIVAIGLLSILFCLVIYCIAIFFKEKYEYYLRKSDLKENDYVIKFIKIEEDTYYISARTKKEAIERFMNDTFKKRVDDKQGYKIKKVEEI